MALCGIARYDQDRLNELFKLFVYGMGVIVMNLILFLAALNFLWSSDKEA